MVKTVMEKSREILIMEKYQLSNLVAKILVKKGLSDQEIEMFLSVGKNFDCNEFDNMDKTVTRLKEAINKDEKIVVYGDYDADGMIAVAVLVKAFKALGKDVGFYIPNRLVDGYGITENMIDRFHEKGYKIIITVDNGINANVALAKAKDYGIDVIMTDHHQLNGDFPECYSYLHPELSNYPNIELSGAMIAYKLAVAMLGYEDEYLLSLAAMTIISDVMIMNEENRYYLKKAKEIINNNKYETIFGLFKGKKFDYDSIGFEIAPKINAIGRLPNYSDPHNVVRYFIDDKFNRKDYAKHLDEVNAHRKKMVSHTIGFEKNVVELENIVYLIEKNVHEGITGLVANRLANQYKKTAFVIAYNMASDLYKGSGRTNVDANLSMLIEQMKDDCVRYGGHAMAVGVSLKEEQIEHFFRTLDEKLASSSNISIDALEVDNNDLAIEEIKSIDVLEPFGNGFKKPVFIIKGVKIESLMVFAKSHIKITFSSGESSYDGFYFNNAKVAKLHKVGENVDVCFTCKVENDKIKIFVEDILASS